MKEAREKALARWDNEGGSTTSRPSGEADRAVAHTAIKQLAASWAASNIFPGPFTQNDAPVYDGVIADFLSEAAAAGFSTQDVEDALGDLRSFMHSAYTDADRLWRANHKDG